MTSTTEIATIARAMSTRPIATPRRLRGLADN
jgi:hypothetical protein